MTTGAILLVLTFQIKAAEPDTIDSTLNEHVVYAMGDPAHPAMLQITTLYPDGSGPFPLAILNHGKAIGEAKNEPRYRGAYLARYFLSRGYAVALPMLHGFAGSGGVFHYKRCDFEGLGLSEADDIVAVIHYMSRQPHIDGTRVVVGGEGLGGWDTLALGVRGCPGVKGLLNFAGGARDRDCPTWEENLATAAGDYGAKSRMPSLWFYGDNDKGFPVPVWRAMYQRYTDAGGKAELVAYGNFMADAHTLWGSLEGFPIWIPKVDAFLAELGLPDKELEARYLPAPFPPASNFAALDDVDAIPQATSKTKEVYRQFLTKPFPRVFVITPGGGCGSFESGFDPLTHALETFQKLGKDVRVYAVDDRVVWVPAMQPPPPTQFAAIDDVDAVPYLNAPGQRGYIQFLNLPKPRAFVIAPDGGWAFSAKGFDPLAKALQICGKNHPNARAYAVDDHVVWPKD